MKHKIRIGGTSNFVSSIVLNKVDLVSGWDNPEATLYDTSEEAEKAAESVTSIEGFRACVEEHR